MPDIATTYYVVGVPDDLQVTVQNLGWENPGRVIHRSVYTGNETVINRGDGRLFGDISIGEVTDPEEAAKIEAWIASLTSPFAITEIPLNRRPLDSYSNTVAGVNFTGGRPVTILANPAGDLEVGHYVRSGLRTLMVTEIISSTEIVVLPHVILNSADILTTATTVRARLDRNNRNTTLAPRDPHWYGPWSFRWVEAPIPF